MSSSPEEGGTRIQRRAPQQQQMQQPPSQGEDPRFIQQQQMYQQQQQQQQIPQQVQQMVQPPILLRKNNKPFFDYNSKSFKYALIVTCIFILLNSKIIWKQIIQFPFMGGVEPSILALLINSILAGIIFYVVSNVISN
jgi:hypothetical protein